jgi:hypothetical protein
MQNCYVLLASYLSLTSHWENILVLYPLPHFLHNLSVCFVCLLDSLAMYSRLASTSWSSCLSLRRAKITSVSYHTTILSGVLSLFVQNVGIISQNIQHIVSGEVHLTGLKMTCLFFILTKLNYVKLSLFYTNGISYYST